MKRILSCIVAVLFVGTLFVPFVHAQTFADITLETIPRYPKSGDSVTAIVRSNDVNLDFQVISWYVNGKPGISGVAQTSTIFTINPNTKSYTIRAVVGEGANQVTRELTITPGEVILLWEAVDSFVPYWYRGKALMPAEGTVRITAVPVGSETLDKLFFVWRQGSNSLGELSGYGKNSIVLRNNVLLDSVDVTVSVSSANGGYQSEGSISIPRTESDVRLWSPRVGFAPTYEQSGILRVYGADATIEALPYGLPSRSGSRGLAYEWLLNQIPYVHQSDEAENSLFLARSAVPILVNLAIQSIDRVLQDVSVQKQIIFE